MSKKNVAFIYEYQTQKKHNHFKDYFLEEMTNYLE